MKRLRMVLSAALVLAVAACAQTTTPADSGGAEGVRKTGGIRYEAGPRGLLDVYRPAGEGPFPVIFFVFGGAWESGDRQEYSFIGEAFAHRGFVTVIADYMLYPPAVYPDFLWDGAAAMAWTVENIADYDGDPERLAIVGHSAGSYNAAMLAYDKRWLSGAGVDPAVVDAFVGVSGPYEIYPYTFPPTEEVFGNTPNNSTEPFEHFDAGNPPALLLHGTKDATVGHDQSQLMAAKMRIAGLSAHLVLLAGETHMEPLYGMGLPPKQNPAVVDPIMTFLNDLIGPVGER